MAEIFTVDNVTFAYNGRKALREISFSVEKGEFIGVVGPNGSGKSTLIKLMSGLLSPLKGKIFYQGKPLAIYKREEIARNIAVVPQSFNLDFNFTVFEVIKMGRYVRRKDNPQERLREIIRRLELEDFKERFFPQLSGGEKQRVVLAQALAQEPEILLLDEPAAHLDISYQLKLFNLLKKFNQEGLTVVCVLHDLNLALNYPQRLVMLSEGQKIADGSPEEVLIPINIREVYGVEASLHQHAGKTFLTFSPHRKVRKKQKTVHLICGGGTGSSLMRKLVDQGFSATVGVVNALDTDEVTGRELGISMAVEAPFCEISDESHLENLKFIEKADLIILTEVPIGNGNFRNIEALKYGVEKGKEVWVIGDIGKRDFTGRAKIFINSLQEVQFFNDEKEILQRLSKE